jgi:hypothetical protein
MRRTWWLGFFISSKNSLLSISLTRVKLFATLGKELFDIIGDAEWPLPSVL